MTTALPSYTTSRDITSNPPSLCETAGAGWASGPVILDDALVYSEDDRIEKMFDALHRQSRDQQIIVFSCRQRAFAKLGGRVPKMVSWTPAL
jgi:hypothetical protein